MEEFLDHVPYTEEEALGLIEPGIYPAYIEKVEIKQSNSGNRFFVATVNVTDSNKSHKVFSVWLALKHMLKHAYDSAGLEDKFKQSKLSTKDLEGKKVMVKVKLKPGNELYPNPKNEIVDFIKPENNLFNDEISF